MSRSTRDQASAPIPKVVVAPRVYWDKRHRVFFGKYRLNGHWKNKVVPVNLDTEEKATHWFHVWVLQFEQTGVEPVNDEVKVERKTIRNLAKRWLAWRREE